MTTRRSRLHGPRAECANACCTTIISGRHQQVMMVRANQQLRLSHTSLSVGGSVVPAGSCPASLGLSTAARSGCAWAPLRPLSAQVHRASKQARVCLHLQHACCPCSGGLAACIGMWQPTYAQMALCWDLDRRRAALPV